MTTLVTGLKQIIEIDGIDHEVDGWGIGSNGIAWNLSIETSAPLGLALGQAARFRLPVPDRDGTYEGVGAVISVPGNAKTGGMYEVQSIGHLFTVDKATICDYELQHANEIEHGSPPEPEASLTEEQAAKIERLEWRVKEVEEEKELLREELLARGWTDIDY